MAVMALVTAVSDMIIGFPAFDKENTRVARQAAGSWPKRDQEDPRR
jgi:hypothetical protein